MGFLIVWTYSLPFYSYSFILLFFYSSIFLSKFYFLSIPSRVLLLASLLTLSFSGFFFQTALCRAQFPIIKIWFFRITVLFSRISVIWLIFFNDELERSYKPSNKEQKVSKKMITSLSKKWSLAYNSSRKSQNIFSS